jgi:hypothetical protein
MNGDFIQPNPGAGLPPQQNMELTKYMSQINAYQTSDDGNNLIIEDAHIREELLIKFNGFLSNDIIWSRLSENKITAYKYAFRAARVGFLMSKKREDVDDKLLNEMDNLQFLVFSRLDRALDGWERQKMTEMTQQTFYGQVQPPKTSALGRVKGWAQNIGDSLLRPGGQ